MKRSDALLISLAVLVVSCGRPRLDRESAEKLIAASRVAQDPLGTPGSTVRIKIVSVDGIASSSDGTQATADFKWSFVGGALDDPNALTVPEIELHTYTGKASFRLYDDGWRLDEDSVRSGIAHPNVTEQAVERRVTVARAIEQFEQRRERERAKVWQDLKQRGAK